MKKIIPLFLLFLLAACSSPADKNMLDYEQSLCRADSLARCGIADSARTVRLFSDYMAMGHTVKIEGVGTFYYTAATNKRRVAMPEEVNSGQINRIRVRFLPEVKRSSGKQITTCSMVNTNVDWTDIEKLANGSTSGGNTEGGNGGGSGNDQNKNPSE